MSHPYRTARLRVYGGRGSRALALVGAYVSPSMRGSRGNIARHIRREAAPPPRPVADLDARAMAAREPVAVAA